jgi:antitoxin component YwqK of YwqJK toxin-antitoxin module
MGFWAVALLAIAGCGSADDATSESSGEDSGDGSGSAVAQLGDGTEFYQYAPKQKKPTANPGITEVKPIKVADQKFTYPPQSTAPEVIADVEVFSDKSLIFDGQFQEYRSDGKTPHAVGVFKQDRRDGKWTYYHPNGKVAKEVNYVDGRLDGSWTHFNEDGAKMLDATYKNGKRHGTWTQYGAKSEDGKQSVVQTTQYTDGLINGSFVQYYANGQKRVEQRFEMGLPEGTQTQWYQDGTKYVEKTFVKGKQNGTETIWNPKGEVVKQREFRDGAPLLSARGDAAKSGKAKPETGG